MTCPLFLEVKDVNQSNENFIFNTRTPELQNEASDTADKKQPLYSMWQLTSVALSDEVGNWWITFNLFTPKSDQLQFSLSVSYQKYIIQYGELGNR